ncbi:MAG: glutaredoxin domain-containing protein [Deltaproteobacteria bacterium]|nr:glutaredoxin domain-containing protein [Deltaproteobacteria bacterium]
MNRIFVIGFLAFTLVPACRKEVPATPPPAAESKPVEVAKDGGWLFTYATPEGEFCTVEAPDQVPEVSRGVVRAINPKDNPAAARSEVLVVDVAKLLDKGKTPAKRVGRDLFETQALALLPPGASSILADRPSDADGGAADETNNLNGRQAAVILYGTSWCGACRTARQYFIAKNIPFVDKDVEKDAAAADELQKKAARLGVSTDRVPILDVRGRLLIGFDPKRVEALLGDVI